MMASRQRSRLAYSRQSGAAGLGGCGGEGLFTAGKGGRQAATGQTMVLIICLTTPVELVARSPVKWFIKKVSDQPGLRGVYRGVKTTVEATITGYWRDPDGQYSSKRNLVQGKGQTSLPPSPRGIARRQMTVHRAFDVERLSN